MNESIKLNCIMVGLPETGKTTFLAALYNLLDEADVVGALKLYRLPKERHYLNYNRRKWVDYEEVGRTNPNVETPEQVSLSLIDSANGEIGVELVVPDISGEKYKQYLEHREWPEAFDEFVKSVSGLLLFIHPDHVTPATLILEVERNYPGLPKSEGDPPSDQETMEDWDPNYLPAQVELVDLLQFFHRQMRHNNPYKIAVIVSAWDKVESLPENYDPESWLKVWLPLLHQYLNTTHSDNFRIYGISALGGDLKTDLEKITKVNSASQRIKVVDDDVITNDITAPIRWIVESLSMIDERNQVQE